ncbi:SPOR domain-containing protein [Treponema sp. HNW]|uniref:SPOR domain-containing protein n=1 Tax=Treponema sp. HNW TaxID=3116654 RepID=UPI003D0EB3D8
MEDKRILWVSAAVGIFLLIIVGTALVLYAPSKNGDVRLTALPAGTDESRTLQPQKPVPAEGEQGGASAENRADSSSTQNAAPVFSDTAAPAGTDASNLVQSRDLTVISNNTTVYTKDGLTTIDLSSLAERPEQKPVDVPQGMQLAPDVKTLVPINPSEYMGAQPITQPKTAPALKPAPAPKTSAAKTTSVKKPAAKPAPKPADRYWVQAASFTDKMNAETARSLLADEKIPAEVFTYQDKKGLTYYRLRVGPYTTESEAEYWNSRIKLIDHFASTQSYVTNSSKTVK